MGIKKRISGILLNSLIKMNILALDYLAVIICSNNIMIFLPDYLYSF